MPEESVADYLKALFANRTFARQITGHRVLEGSDAVHAENRRPWSHAVRMLLDRAGIRLYSHQAEATDHIRAGRDVIVTTPTASGKTLVYNLPVLERFAQCEVAREMRITRTIKENVPEHFFCFGTFFELGFWGRGLRVRTDTKTRPFFSPQ